MATVFDISHLSLEKKDKVYEITGKKESLLNLSRMPTEQLKKLKGVISGTDNIKVIHQEDKCEDAINTIRQLLKEQRKSPPATKENAKERLARLVQKDRKPDTTKAIQTIKEALNENRTKRHN